MVIQNTSTPGASGVKARNETTKPHLLSHGSTGYSIYDGLNESITKHFIGWLSDNQHIYNAFLVFAKKAYADGRRRIGSRRVFEGLRWDTGLTEVSNFDFKINNNFAPHLARKAMADNPYLQGLFSVKRGGGSHE
ncbi:MAG: hypothetical protein HOE82_06670 [Gammaproteobacteria bacterium]|jgi:hypothetical protein|nr:hypothetical protein [Gammaproteobacteria bacterium]MBT5466486.1 hypothetical protein [Candidatus Neomarinimicrobiota bacterium]